MSTKPGISNMLDDTYFGDIYISLLFLFSDFILTELLLCSGASVAGMVIGLERLITQCLCQVGMTT